MPIVMLTMAPFGEHFLGATHSCGSCCHYTHSPDENRRPRRVSHPEERPPRQSREWDIYRRRGLASSQISMSRTKGMGSLLGKKKGEERDIKTKCNW